MPATTASLRRIWQFYVRLRNSARALTLALAALAAVSWGGSGISGEDNWTILSQPHGPRVSERDPAIIEFRVSWNSTDDFPPRASWQRYDPSTRTWGNVSGNAVTNRVDSYSSSTGAESRFSLTYPLTTFADAGLYRADAIAADGRELLTENADLQVLGAIGAAVIRDADKLDLRTRSRGEHAR